MALSIILQASLRMRPTLRNRCTIYDIPDEEVRPGVVCAFKLSERTELHKPTERHIIYALLV